MSNFHLYACYVENMFQQIYYLRINPFVSNAKILYLVEAEENKKVFPYFHEM